MYVTFLNINKFLLFQYSENVEIFENICDACLRLTISSYKFIKRSKDNFALLGTAIEDLNNGFENTTEDFTNVETLYVNINPMECTIQQFYDNKRLALPQETALPRFRFIAHGQYSANPNKKRNNERPRVRDFSTIFIRTTELIADPSKKKEFKCKMCLKEYPSSGCLRQHFFSTHFKKEFQCSECPKSFGTLGLLQSHINVSHSTVECHICGKQLKNRTSTIKRHQMMHNSATKVCFRCGRSYKKSTDFNRHMAQDSCAVPSKVKGNFTCDHCGYHCSFKHQLLAHIKYEHTDAEGFLCKWCGRKCYSQSALKTHVLKHTKEKNFTCTECGGRFVTRQSLLNHTRLHTGERPYKCDFCDQCFLSASRRRDHIDRHHLPSSYDCDMCDAKYNARRSLVKHRKRHMMGHEEQTVTEEIAEDNAVIVDERYVTEVVVEN